ncbi:SPOR domain-containing protein [Methylophilus aquaticus]|uniref:SPOR domain-containing protein n=1 Tax=Methylophilus aquaticus TaxID=1971610 RepID=A0ABT9JSP4_9PROT|nr:SPOR domain-containing protein [Methylophilus aquaticus]MDP8567574.1 SPOR domain-containing protein [Methylophilus aquaticus]
MKRLVWILLLLNVLVFAYFKLADLTPVVSTLKPELHPEQMKLLTEQSLNDYPRRSPAQPVQEGLNALAENAEGVSDVAAQVTTPGATEVVKTDIAKSEIATPEIAISALSKPSNPRQDTKVADKAESKPTVHMSATHVCYEWGSFNLARINEAVDAANQLGIKNFVNQQTGAVENTRYWIYKPPLASAEAAQIKADELRKLGVEDFFIVQDPKWRNAISFGVFRDEQLADKLMTDLKAKGVRLLVKSTRYGGQGQAVVKLQDVTVQQFANLKKTQPQFPDSVLKETPCP